MSVENQKQAAGEAAALLVEEGMIVGLGTGSTAAWFVKALAARALHIRCVATSEATAALASSLGMTLVGLDEVDRIDLTVDGADELAHGLALIKGGGGALLREKLVWKTSDRCVVIADAGKQVRRLGAFPLPVEVIPFGHASTARRIATEMARAGWKTAPTLRMQGEAPFVTDGGNLIYDLACPDIADPHGLGHALKAITGVVDHGLFVDLVERAIIGTDDGVITLRA